MFSFIATVSLIAVVGGGVLYLLRDKVFKPEMHDVYGDVEDGNIDTYNNETGIPHLDEDVVNTIIADEMADPKDNTNK